MPAIKIFYENSIPGLYRRICTGLSTKLSIWRIRVSIPVHPACEAGALPFELIPRVYTCSVWEEIVQLELVSVYQKRRKLLENPGIDPGTSRMLSGRSTI